MSIKVKSFLAMAANCKSTEDAHALEQSLADAFSATLALGHLPRYNDDFAMEGGQAYAKFELNRVLSDHYITAIQPEIRHGKLVVVVATNRMRDGRGMQGSDWERVEGLDEDLIEPDEDQSIPMVANKARALALAHHAMLIERVGVPQRQALVAAKRSW